MEAIQKVNALSSNLFGVNLQRASDGSIDGEISFGAPNQDKYQGPISHTSLVAGASIWEIPIDDAKINGKPCSMTGKSAIIDTGTTFMLLPPADAEQLHSQILGSQQESEIFNIPCASKALVQLIFSGVPYDISPADYVGYPISHGSRDVFLKNVYSVFDYDEKQFGFASKISQSPSASAYAKQATSSIQSTVIASHKSATSTSSSIAATPTTVANTVSPSTSRSPQEANLASAADPFKAGHRVDHNMTEDPRMDADPDDLTDERATFLPRAGRDAQLTTTVGDLPSVKRSLSERGQSSILGTPRTPRTAHRVRFEVEERNSSEYAPNGRIADPASHAEEDDYFSHHVSAARGGSTGQRAPLLTGIEAPSVTIASIDLDLDAEDFLESSRPKSGMRSAFMNMANSIIGAGIIGIA
ncbi:MAG: hypothetical protein Q9207_001132 [Kuettlingeria erythrocarpa]